MQSVSGKRWSGLGPSPDPGPDAGIELGGGDRVAWAVSPEPTKACPASGSSRLGLGAPAVAAGEVTGDHADRVLGVGLFDLMISWQAALLRKERRW
jgi:hypothetical protein